MRGRLSLNALVVGGAGLVALILTIANPSPKSLIPFGMSDREARAAPGEPASSVQQKHNLTALKVFNRTLVRIRDSYVEPSRIEPKEMLYSALDSVQFNIPEVLVEAEPDKDELTVVVNDKQAKFSTKDVDSPWRLSGKLKKIFRFIEANMNSDAELADVEYAAVNGMLNTLDPHSVLLDPEMAREMDVNTSGKFGGLGIVIGMRDKRLTVIRPMKGTPASRAGVEAKDHIVKIDDEVTENLTLNEAVQRMRGNPGTDVVLWVKRKGKQDLLRFEITRDIIRVPSVEHKLLSKNVGYLRIKQFAGRTAKEVEQAMAELRKQGARAWIVDLRWNPGGLLEQAIQVADLFVDQGTLVTTLGGGEREPRRANRKGSDTKSPVAVLTSNSSASASEIVAGALKHLDRAILIGKTTFGKGSVQILYDNSDGSKLKLTIAQYLTPDNLSIQSLGIVPDIELHRMLVPDENEDADDTLRLLPPSQSYREKDLKAHLDSKYAKDPPKPAMQLSYLYEREEEEEEDLEEGESPLEEQPPPDDEVRVDFQIELARDLLATSGSPSRKQMIRAAKKRVARHRAEETQELGDALTALGIDWSAPPKKKEPSAKLDADFYIKGRPKEIRAGQEVELVGEVKNSGAGAAYRVHARVDSQDRVFKDTELVFGKIEPGETKTYTAHVKVPEEALDRLDYLEFNVTEARGAPVEAAPQRVRVVAAERPMFAYTHQLIDDSNGDGLVQPGEKHRLLVTIRNIGKGKAEETTAILRNASGDDILIRKARFELGKLAPGEKRTVEFIYETRPQVKGDEVVVEMTVYDSVLRESVAEKLKYPVIKDSAGPSRARGAARVLRDDTPLYEGASARASQVGEADQGAVFNVTGRLGDWLRVELGSGRPGFVRKKAVERTRKRPKLSRFQPLWQVTPPSLNLQVSSYEVQGDSYRLRGEAVDDSRVADVYVFVSNRQAKIENKKVFYKSNRNGKSPKALSFASEIPLWPGSNRVTVVARENDEVKSSHTLYLYRQGEGGKTASVRR